MLKIPDFTQPEIDYLIEKCNFTEREETLFHLRNKGKSLEECAEDMNLSVPTISRINKKLKSKIIRVL